MPPETHVKQQRPGPPPAGTRRSQALYQGSPYQVGTPRQTPRTPCASAVCPGPRPPTHYMTLSQPMRRLSPYEPSPTRPTSPREQPGLASTPIQEGGAAYFGSPGKTPAFFCSPGQTPITVCDFVIFNV